MAIALVVLAIGSVLAGFIGVPHALGGHNQIEAFLEPSFQAPSATEPRAAARGRGGSRRRIAETGPSSG